MSELDGAHKNIPSPDDINITEFAKQVPKILLTFVSWLVDNDKFQNASEEELSSNTKAVASSNILMGSFTEYSGNNFGTALGLYIYHTVRSRKIINLLHKFGLSII